MFIFFAALNVQLAFTAPQDLYFRNRLTPSMYTLTSLNSKTSQQNEETRASYRQILNAYNSSMNDALKKKKKIKVGCALSGIEPGTPSRHT